MLWETMIQWAPVVLRRCFDAVWQVTLPWIITILLLMLLRPFLLRRYSVKCYLNCMRIMMGLLIMSMTAYSGNAYWQIPGPDVLLSHEVEVSSAPREEMPAEAPASGENLAQGQESLVMQTQSQQQTTETPVPTAKPEKQTLPELYQIWAVGMALFLLFHLVQYGRMQWYLHKGREKITDPALLESYQQLHKEMPILIRKPRIYCHRGLPSSICVGLFRKTIYVDTQDRDLEEMKWVLRHELYHCDNGDMLGRWVFLVVQAMHWFNPLMYWLIDQLEWSTELECDAKVVDGADLQARKAYSMAILNSIREGNRKRARLSTAFVENRKTLEKRLEAIVDMQHKKKGRMMSFLVTAAVIFCFTFVGCTPVESQQTTEAVQTDLTRELYDARTPYIGGASDVGKILGLLPLPNGLTYHEEGMELFTDEGSPFGAKQHLMFTEATTEAEKQALLSNTDQLERNAYLFLALVDNADFLEYKIHDTPTTESVTFHFDRQMAEKYYGDIDLRSLTSDFDTFAAFVEELNILFDCPFTETLETAGRENWVENYQTAMELVQNISAEMPLQGDFAAWADQIRQSEAFAQLVALKDDALIYCLMQMPGGTDTESYVTMLAADELACGSRRDGVSFDETPEEWYQVYCALDSQYTVPFYKGLEQEYAEMPEAEYLSLSKEAARSRVTSKETAVQAVYKALSAYKKEDTLNGHELVVFAPLILDVAETEDTLQVCCVVGDDRYRMNRVGNQGYCLLNEGGSRVPARLDFVKEQGEWKLEEIHWAKDGSGYTSSIEEMAPNKAVAQKMIDFDSDDMTRLLYDNLIQYMNLTDTSYMVYDMGYKTEDLQQELRQFLQLA